MPVFNDRDFIEKSIQSLLNQTFCNFELIISDDCSTDGSQDICLRYANLDSRIKYIRHAKNIGISNNMKFVLCKAVGEYFMWAGDDDLWAPNFVEVLYDLLKKNTDCIAAFTPWVSINEDDNIIKEKNIHRSNYASSFTLIRLLKLCYYWDDGFGYGLFVRDKILNVNFPVWWWINKIRAYNNIYPTLFYYLTKGNFVMHKGEPLWFNREKTSNHVNHKLPYANSFCRGLFANYLWKFNVYIKCLGEVIRASNLGSIYVLFLLPIFILGLMWYYVKMGVVFFVRLLLGKCRFF